MQRTTWLGRTHSSYRCGWKVDCCKNLLIFFFEHPLILTVSTLALFAAGWRPHGHPWSLQKMTWSTYFTSRLLAKKTSWINTAQVIATEFCTRRSMAYLSTSFRRSCSAARCWTAQRISSKCLCGNVGSPSDSWSRREQDRTIHIKNAHPSHPDSHGPYWRNTSNVSLGFTMHFDFPDESE